MTGTPNSTWSRLPRGARLALRLVLALGLLVGIAGCSGADGADGASTDSDTSADGGSFAPGSVPAGTSEEGDQAATDEGAGGTGGTGGTDSASVTSVSAAQLASDRKQILRADLVVQSDSVLTDARLAEAAATAVGGVVTDEQTATDLGAPDATTARTVSVLTMRVPPAALDELLVRLGELGTVLSQNRGSEDVTDQYVDVAARVDSQRASLDRLLALVTDAADLTDIVTLENEISRRQSDLDALSARLQSLDEQVTLATVTLTLTSPDTAAVAASTSGFLAGLGNGWDAFTGALVGALTVLGAVLPFAVTFAVISIPLYLLRVRRRSGPPVLTTAEPPAL